MIIAVHRHARLKNRATLYWLKSRFARVITIYGTSRSYRWVRVGWGYYTRVKVVHGIYRGFGILAWSPCCVESLALLTVF